MSPFDNVEFDSMQGDPQTCYVHHTGQPVSPEVFSFVGSSYVFKFLSSVYPSTITSRCWSHCSGQRRHSPLNSGCSLRSWTADNHHACASRMQTILLLRWHRRHRGHSWRWWSWCLYFAAESQMPLWLGWSLGSAQTLRHWWLCTQWSCYWGLSPRWRLAADCPWN